MHRVHSVSQRTILTVSTALCLTGAYWLYAQSVGRLAQPPEVVYTANQIAGADTLPDPSPPAFNVEMAQRHLAPLGCVWAAQAKLQFRSDHVLVYAEEWTRDPDSSAQREGENALRFSPFAMLWIPDDGGEPFAVVAEAARIVFEGEQTPEPDVPFTPPGEVIRGALEGKVQITGPDGLAVDARDVVYSREAHAVWSDHPVRFAFAQHRGRGSGLQVELREPTATEKSGDLAFGGVERIRLRRDVQLQLVLNDKTHPDRPARPVLVRSAGGLEYQPEAHIAVLRDRVEVEHPTSPTESDRLRCDRLELVFEPTESQRPATTPSGNDRSLPAPYAAVGISSQKLAFRRARASGAPQRPVVVVSESRGLTATMADLLYDAETRIAALTAPGGVVIRRPTESLRCPEVTFRHDEHGEIVSAWCRGAGRLTHRSASDQAAASTVSWSRNLRLYPDPVTGESVLEVDGSARVEQLDRRASLSAAIIRLWFESQENEAVSVPSRHRGAEGLSPVASVRPKRLLAVDDVTLDVDGLNGRTNRLEVWFELEEPVAATATPADRSSAENNAPNHATPASRSTGEKDKTRGPLHVSADLIRVLVATNGESGEMRLRELRTDGHVEMTEPTTGADEGFHLSGSFLRLVADEGPGNEVLHLTGEPARVSDRGAGLEGRHLHVDRGRGRAWVDGAGVLEIPIQEDLEGRRLAQPTTLKVRWKEGMELAGRTAHFRRDVSADLDASHMTCHDMAVTFTEPIQFGRSPTKTEIRSIQCTGGVTVDSRTAGLGGRAGLRRGKFWEFSLDRKTGKTIAQGPGTLEFWWQGNGRHAALAPAAVVRPNRPLATQTSQWQYARIDFDGASTGNIYERTTTFRDGVQIVYGPVSRPLEVIRPEDLPRDGGWMRADVLTLTQKLAPDGQPSHVELESSGNVYMKGHTLHGRFHARADTVSFDESKGLYVIRSLGKQSATIWRQAKPGGPYNRADVRSAWFVPSRNELTLDRTSSFEGVQ